MSFPRDLLRGPRGEAGGAEPGLMGVVVQAKCHTAMDLWGHPDPRVRAVWEGMRWRGYMAMQSGRLTLGGKIGEVEGILEQRSQGARGVEAVASWLASLDVLLRERGAEWDDG